jgi:hypothetical protein
MSLSPTSFEILSDLLAIRLESFLVTSTDEAREMRQLKICQHELERLHALGRQMSTSKAPAAPIENAKKPKLSRRLQRLVNDLQTDSSRAASF